MKRILFIIHDINYGGAAKMLSFVANSLLELGYDVYVYTYMGDSTNYVLSDSIIYYSENLSKKNRLLRFLSPILPVRRKIHEISPDVVISFLTNANLYSALGTIFTKIPVILCERGDPYMENTRENRFKKVFYNFAEGFVFQTEGAMSFYNKGIQKRSEIIPNPVMLPNISIIPFEDRINEISFIARFDIKQKRQDLMVEAFSRVAKEIDDLNLVFYGDGKDMEAIKEKVDKLGLSNRIIFRGRVSNIYKYIRYSKLSVLTSDFEGIPNAIIESMTMGIPVVSTDCSPGGARLLIEDYSNGIIVPRGDVTAISDAIIYLFKDQKSLRQYSTNSENIINKFSPKKITSDWSEYIENVISRNM